jgi:hypothetical protein
MTVLVAPRDTTNLDTKDKERTYNTIRRALEALDD